MDLFYTPEYAKTGAVIPYYNEKTGRFDHVYLKNRNPEAPKEKGTRLGFFVSEGAMEVRNTRIETELTD